MSDALYLNIRMISWYIIVPNTTKMKPISFSKFNSNPFSYRAYWSSSYPIVNVKSKQNDHIITVLHTSARDRETGFITFEIVTARGTDMPIENNSPTM